MTSGPLSGNPEPTCFWVTPGGASLISQTLLFLAPDGILIGQLQPHSGVVARDGRRIAFFLNLPLFLPREPETPLPGSVFCFLIVRSVSAPISRPIHLICVCFHGDKWE